MWPSESSPPTLKRSSSLQTQTGQVFQFIWEVGAALKFQRCLAKPWTAAACCRLSEVTLLPPKSPGCRKISLLPQAWKRHGEMESWNARRPAGWPPESGSRLPQSKWLPVFDRFRTNLPAEPAFRPAPFFVGELLRRSPARRRARDRCPSAWRSPRRGR